MDDWTRGSSVPSASQQQQQPSSTRVLETSHGYASVDGYSMGSASTVDLGEPAPRLFDDDEDSEDSEESEIGALIKMALGYFVASASWVGMKLTDAALIGHVGTVFLDGAAYSDLYTSSFGVLIQGQVLTMFCSQAFGARNYSLVGTWLKVSFLCLIVISLPVAVSWSLTEQALEAFGVKNARLRSIAGTYALILMTCLPARIGFQQLAQFFVSQKRTRPPATAAVAGLLTNVAMGLVFVFGFPGFPGFGFVACPAVTSFVEYLQCILLAVIAVYPPSQKFFSKQQKKLFAFFETPSKKKKKKSEGDVYDYVRQERRRKQSSESSESSSREGAEIEEEEDLIECRPSCGWLALEDVTRERVREYLRIYVPAALASASDFWRLSAVGAIAATLSEDDLGVFNASYRIMWLSLAFAGAVGTAIGARLGLRVGQRDARGAKRGVFVGILLTLGLLIILTCLVALLPRQLGSIFTRDRNLLDKFEESRYSLAAVVFLMNLAVVLEKIPMACGYTRIVFIVGFGASWCVQVPAVLLFVNFWRQSLTAVFLGVATGYGLLCILLFVVVFTIDYDDVLKQAARRSELLLSEDLLSQDLHHGLLDRGSSGGGAPSETSTVGTHYAFLRFIKKSWSRRGTNVRLATVDRRGLNNRDDSDDDTSTRSTSF